MDLTNYYLFRNIRRQKLEKLVTCLVEMEELSVEKIALILSKICKEDLDNAILEACKRRRTALFCVAIGIAKQLRHKIFKSTLLRHIDEGTDQVFLSDYENIILIRYSVAYDKILITRKRDALDAIDAAISKALVTKILETDKVQTTIEKIKYSNVSVEESAEIIRECLREDDGIISFKSHLNMTKLALSTSENEEDRQLAAKIDAALAIAQPKELTIQKLDEGKES